MDVAGRYNVQRLQKSQACAGGGRAGEEKGAGCCRIVPRLCVQVLGFFLRKQKKKEVEVDQSPAPPTVWRLGT